MYGWCPWGVLEVSSGPVVIYIIQRWFDGKPILRKIGRFPLCVWKWGGSAHVAKRAFGDQMGPNVQKPMPLGSPHHQGQKKYGLSQNISFIFYFDFLGAQRGDFCGLRAGGHISWLAYYLTGSAAPGRLNAALV